MPRKSEVRNHISSRLGDLNLKPGVNMRRRLKITFAITLAGAATAGLVAGPPATGTATAAVPDKLVRTVSQTHELSTRAGTAPRRLTVAMAKRDIAQSKARAKSHLRLLQKQARTASEKRVVQAASRQIQDTERKYRKVSSRTTNRFWVPALIFAARIVWAARSSAMVMLKSCLKARSCTAAVTKGAEKLTGASVASALAAGQRRFQCFTVPKAVFPLVKCLATGRKK